MPNLLLQITKMCDLISLILNVNCGINIKLLAIKWHVLWRECMYTVHLGYIFRSNKDCGYKFIHEVEVEMCHLISLDVHWKWQYYAHLSCPIFPIPHFYCRKKEKFKIKEHDKITQYKSASDIFILAKKKIFKQCSDPTLNMRKCYASLTFANSAWHALLLLYRKARRWWPRNSMPGVVMPHIGTHFKTISSISWHGEQNKATVICHRCLTTNSTHTR